ncbi:MAG: TadE family protein [Actinomycetia bacterium]|jgi:Flp pilus assembly protein TadG|nr:TadE family protein [Actinomycetes bacterium]
MAQVAGLASPVRAGFIRVKDRDSGASSLEWALLTPVLIFVILFVVQFAMVYHARHVALAAAQSGARLARADTSDAWQSKAEDQAKNSVAQVGPGLLTGVTAVASGDQNDRYIDVRGTAVAIVPGMTFMVHQRAGGPTECFRPDLGDTSTKCG